MARPSHYPAVPLYSGGYRLAAALQSTPARRSNVAKAQNQFAVLIRRLLCLLGQHDFKVIDVVMGFGAGGSVEKVECQHCGLVVTRQG